MSPLEQESTSSAEMTEALGSPLSKRWKRFKSSFLYLIALMIGFGNWNDTKELSTTIYDGLKANFTHQVEERLLSRIDVGNYLAYVEQQLGYPQVVKRSRLVPDIEFRYYKRNKFLLTLLVDEGRINGYLVQTLDYQGVFSRLSVFAPPVPFSQNHLNLDSYHRFRDSVERYHLDDFNLVYYMEPHPLGAQGLYLTLYVGTVEYGVSAPALPQLVKGLAEQQTLGIPDDAQLPRLRSQLKPNLYGLGDDNGALMAEALLTRYEYNTYF